MNQMKLNFQKISIMIVPYKIGQSRTLPKKFVLSENLDTVSKGQIGQIGHCFNKVIDYILIETEYTVLNVLNVLSLGTVAIRVGHSKNEFVLFVLTHQNN
jgi:hypothetical protein